ncbi:MAG TPA: hypothetical protein GX733_02820 [Tissierellia bacterium]|jgi:hypothetical protein|nr:hypothetical protein [Tissierellia bacterium]
MKKKILALILSFLLTLGVLSVGGLILIDYLQPSEAEFEQKEIILENVTLEDITP